MIYCYIFQRAGDLAVLKIDFADDFYVKTNVVNRSSFYTRVSGYGGIIGKFSYDISRKLNLKTCLKHDSLKITLVSIDKALENFQSSDSH